MNRSETLTETVDIHPIVTAPLQYTPTVRSNSILQQTLQQYAPTVRFNSTLQQHANHDPVTMFPDAVHQTLNRNDTDVSPN